MDEEPQSGTHVTDEAMAAFVDGDASAYERARVEAHLVGCDDCYAVFIETVRALAEMPIVSVMSPGLRAVPFVRRHGVVAAVGALAAAAALLVVARVQPTMVPPSIQRWVGRGAPSSDLQELVAAVGENRPIEGRLTGGFRYGPLRSPTRGGEKDEDWRVLAVAAKIREQAERDETPANAHALGVAQIVLGKLDDAVPNLEEAAADEPGNARFQSDLAAAYLARAKNFDCPDDYPKALAVAERAVRADPQLLEARFNRALALDALHLGDQAREAWEEYLKADPSGPWAEEARKRIAVPSESTGASPSQPDLAAALQRCDTSDTWRIIDRDPGLVRDVFLGPVLTAWGAHFAAGDCTVQAASAAGERLVSVMGDRQLATIAEDLVARGTRYAAPADPLGAALRRFADARTRLAASDYERAAPVLAEVAAVFRANGSPLAIVAELQLAQADYLANRWDASVDRYGRLRAEADAAGLPAVAARCDWMRGVVSMGRGEFARARASYQRALETFTTMHDRTNAWTVRALLAEYYLTTGDTRRAWQHQVALLGTLDGATGASNQQATLYLAARASAEAGLLEAALRFQDERVARARTAGVTAATVEALLDQATTSAQAGRQAPARAALNEAETLAARAEVTPTALVRAKFASARVALAGDADPLPLIEAALEAWRQASRDQFLPGLFVQRAGVLAAAGRDVEAEADLLQAIDVAERLRRSLRSPLERAVYLGQAAVAFERLTASAAARGDLDRAWSFAERTHAFAGAASASDSVAAFATADRAQAGLYYVALTDRLLVWVARGPEQRARAVEISARALRHDIAQLRRAIAAGRQDEVDSLASSLWSTLVAPVRAEIGDAETLFIVAGGPFEGLPFALLRDTDTGRYLVEDHAIVMLPNWRFLGGVPSAVRLDRDWDVFAAGDPAQADRRLPRLVGGREEVLAIARRFSRVRVVIGREATPASVLAAATHAKLIHVAAHLAPNEEDPGLSRLLLAPDAENPTGELFVRDLVARQPTQLALAVLASCRSGTGRSFAAGLTLTAATPLLEAGVPAVVAALWDADDAGTAEMLDAFYAEASRGPTVARALAEAQRLAVRRGVPPRIWAALVLTGRTT